MGKAYTFENNTIILHRELTELDLFVRDFLSILWKYSSYLVVSGFVSIATGRSRGTEDVDILVPVMEKDQFLSFFEDVVKNGFWCYQGDSGIEAYEYVHDLVNIRFARKNEVFPNIEFVPINATKTLQWFESTHPQKMMVQDFEFMVPPLEFEILYKEKVLGSEKDLADARHLRILFADILDTGKFKEFDAIIDEYS